MGYCCQYPTNGDHGACPVGLVIKNHIKKCNHVILFANQYVTSTWKLEYLKTKKRHLEEPQVRPIFLNGCLGFFPHRNLSPAQVSKKNAMPTFVPPHIPSWRPSWYLGYNICGTETHKTYLQKKILVQKRFV